MTARWRSPPLRHLAKARFGRVDSWVNDPGVAIAESVRDAPDEEQQRQFQTNYFGAVNGCLAAVPTLRDRGGALITVAAIGADLPGAAIGAQGRKLCASETGEPESPRVSVTLVLIQQSVSSRLIRSAYDGLVGGAILAKCRRMSRRDDQRRWCRAGAALELCGAPSGRASSCSGRARAGLALAAGAVAAALRRRRSA